MNIWTLIRREISHRRLNFLLATLAVTLAVATLTAEFTLLARHDANTTHLISVKTARTRNLLAQHEDATRERLTSLITDTNKRTAALNEEMRKIMKKLGFNVLILPREQELTDFYSRGYCAKFMPESHVHKLATSGIMTVRHLLPILEQSSKWPEENNRTIILIGTRGEVPLAHKKPKQALIAPVPPGKIVLGFELWSGLNKKPGDRIKFQGKEFTITKCHAERGTKDDITLWINLATAQEILELPGKINAILALECSCAWANLNKVRAEITKVLPDTQVKEVRSRALSRAEARQKAAASGRATITRIEREGKEALAQEKKKAALSLAGEKRSRREMRQELDGMAAILVPLVILGAAAWVSLLSLSNVRRRRREIGIFRALGLPTGKITAIFLARAATIGLGGAMTGCILGWLAGTSLAETPPVAGGAPPPLDIMLFGVILIAAPLMCALTSWAPALWASRQEPANCLREE